MYKILKKKPIEENENQSEIEFYLCLVTTTHNEEESFEVILHKDELSLFEMLDHIQKSLGLYQQTMNEIWLKIKNYGDYRKDEKIMNAIKETLKSNHSFD
jgi:hypothetical protein